MNDIERLLRDIAKTLANHAKRIRFLESLPTTPASGATPAVHATTHQNGGGDEVNVGGLSGQLADVQLVNVKEEGVSVGNASILNFVGTFTTATFGSPTATITTAITNFTMGFVVPGTLTAVSIPVRIHAPRAGTITNVTATVNTQPTGASVIIDVNKGGATIFSTQANRPTIAASSNDDLSSVPDTTSFNQNDVFTIDVDQIGSTIAGADLVVQIRYTA